MSTGSISQVENYKQGWTDRTLALIADALMCAPGDLLTRNPLTPEAPWSIWETLKPEQKRIAVTLMQAMAEESDNKGTGTDG